MPNQLAVFAASLPQISRTLRLKVSVWGLKKWARLTGRHLDDHVAAERRLRGKDQLDRLRRADVVFVSFGKSGRTWLRVMVSRLYQQMHDLPEDALLGFDNFHNMDKAIPRVFFTHDNYIGDYTGHKDSKVDFYGKKVVLLARDPRDVAVSQFFQWMYRMKPEKKLLNEYPPHGTELSLFDFVMHPGGGMPKVIDFMNLWAREMGNVKDICVIRYEDMRAEPEKTLAQLAEFMEMGATDAQIREAVEYASFESLKKKEAAGSFRFGGGRMMPGDKNNPNSYKVRRAKVGGYRDYFEDEQVRAIDELMESTLDPVYGYRASEPVEK